MVKLFDAAVIGASVSGASVAGNLGREGLEVALIDRDHFPRRKACGEGVSDIAIEALRRMGLDGGLHSLEGAPFYSYRIDLNGRSFAFASRRKKRLKGIGIQRYHLDQLLADHAASLPTVTSFFDTAVTEITKSGTHHHLRFGNGETIATRTLVLADGSNSPNAARLKVPKSTTGKPMWGMSFLFEGRFSRTSGEVLVILKDGFEINCTPVGPRNLNISFLAEKHRVSMLQEPQFRARLLDEAMEKSHFSGSPVGRSLQIGPVGSTRRPYAHGSALLVGDAAESLDPIAGMGMTHGILTGECAAKAIVSHLIGGASLDQALRSYASEAAKLARPFRGFTQLTASLLRSPMRGVLVPALSFAKLPEVVRTSLDSHRCGQPSAALLMNLFLALIGA